MFTAVSRRAVLLVLPSRGNDGQITFHDWHPVGAQEYGYVAADPLNPNIIYGGKLSKL